MPPRKRKPAEEMNTDDVLDSVFPAAVGDLLRDAVPQEEFAENIGENSIEEEDD